MGMFDAASFASQSLKNESAEKTIPCPLGGYPMTIEKIEFRSWEKDDMSGVSMDVLLEVNSPEAQEACQSDKVLVKHGCRIDTIEVDGKLCIDDNPLRNVDLGRLRRAVGLNDPGEDFTPEMLIGRQVFGVVSHRPDKDDPETLYAEVKRGKIKSMNDE